MQTVSTIRMEHCYTYGPPTCALVLLLALGLKSVLWFASVALAAVLGKDCLALCRHAVAYRRSTSAAVTPTGNTVELLVNDSPALVDLTVSASRMPTAEVAPLLTVTGGTLRRSILAPLTRRTLRHRGGEAFEVERTVTSADSDAGPVSMLKIKPLRVELVAGSVAPSAVIKYVNHLGSSDDAEPSSGRAALVRFAGEGIARTVAAGRTVAAAARSPKSAFAEACRWAAGLPVAVGLQSAPLLRRLLRAATTAKEEEEQDAVAEVGLEMLSGSMLCCAVDASSGLCRSSLRATEPALARRAMPAAVLHHRETAMPCFAVQDEHGDVLLLGEEAALPPMTNKQNNNLLATPAGMRVVGGTSAEKLHGAYEVPEEAEEIVATARSVGRGEVQPGHEACFVYKPDGRLGVVVRKQPSYYRDLLKHTKLALYCAATAMCAANVVAFY